MSNLKLSERLIELMTLQNLNNEALGEALNINDKTVGRWKNGTSSIKLSNALKLADYFNCSLDFLTGRSENMLDFTPKPCPPFYEHLLSVLSNQKISRNKINRETNIKSSHFVDWKNGSDPNIISLIELADYLDITLDTLVGREN